MTMRFGLIGTGHWAQDIHGASVAAHPRTDLVGVWGRDQAKAAEAASALNTRAYADLDALLGDVDALTFAVPPDVQVEIATRAAGRGRHLLLEKPVATSAAAAAQVERAVTEAGVASIVFFTRRFRPETQAWLDRLAEVGGWQCGRADFAASIFVPGNPFGASPWRREKGALWDIGPHALSILLPVLGPVTAVLAAGGQGDQVHLAMRHASGGSSTVSLSLTAPEAAVGTVVYVYGEAGREQAPQGSGGSAQTIAAHQAAIDALLAQVEQPGVGHPCDVHFGARVVEVLAAAEAALASGCTVQPGTLSGELTK
jgi:predicted dehydrogenase